MKNFIYNMVPRIIGTRAAIALGQAVHRMRCRLAYGTPNVFHDVAIEIDTLCNRSCFYCPQSLTKFPRAQMTDELFFGVLHKLSEFGFVGQVNLSIFNEPLLDDRLCKFVSWTRTNLPKCTIIVNTNGDKLTVELAKKLLRLGVTKFVITDHPPHSESWTKRIDEVVKTNPSCFRVQRLGKLKNVAGLIPGIASGPFSNPCTSPRDVLVIRHNGDVGICCCDYYRKVTMGNITTGSIRDIWFSPDFVTTREHLLGGFRNWPICISCNGGYVP